MGWGLAAPSTLGPTCPLLSQIMGLPALSQPSGSCPLGFGLGAHTDPSNALPVQGGDVFSHTTSLGQRIPASDLKAKTKNCLKILGFFLTLSKQISFVHKDWANLAQGGWQPMVPRHLHPQHQMLEPEVPSPFQCTGDSDRDQGTLMPQHQLNPLPWTAPNPTNISCH